jgi:hypothetical protein
MLGQVFGGASGESAGAARLLGAPVFARPANSAVPNLLLKRAQQTYGNRFVQRVVNGIQRKPAASRSMIQRHCACGGTCPDCRAQTTEEPSANSLTSTESSRVVQAQEAAGRETAKPDSPPEDLIPTGNSGEPLDKGTRRFMESRFGTELGHVQLHTNSEAARSAKDLGADAYTTGRDIYFAQGKYAPSTAEGRGLLGHEIAHVIQQQDHPQPAAFSTSGGDALEAEAQAASEAVQGDRTVTIAGRARGLQTQEGGVAEWAENKAWSLLKEYAPELSEFVREIVRQGFFEWMKDQVSGAVQALFDRLMAPIRIVTGVVQGLMGHFNDLVAWMHEAADKIAHGDCSSITEAAEKIQKVIDGLASPLIDKVKEVAGRVSAFFKGLWDRFGAPAWEFLKNLGGAVWEKIQGLAAWIWKKSEPLRKLGERAWTWLKNKLGVGEGPEGQDGLLQWVQRKAGEAWDWVKAHIEPIKKPLMVVGGILLLLSPAGPLIAIGAGVAGLILGIRWIRQHLNSPNGVVDQQSFVRHTILPAIMGAVDSVTSALRKAAAFVTDKLNAVVGSLGEAIGAAAASIFRFIVGALQWIVDQFNGLVHWATEKLMGLVDWIKSGLDRLHTFLQPLLNFLAKIGEVVLDIMQLPALVLGSLWKRIPACIRDPFVNFLINQVLKRIPLFRQLTEVIPAVWSQIKAAATAIIHKVFKEGDLLGAAFEVFKLLLAALKIPVQLVTGIVTKAGSAIDQILKEPLGFLKNVLRAVSDGFVLFGKNIKTHLIDGVKGWILGSLSAANVHVPKDFTLESIFTFVLEVLDITVEKVLSRLELKIGKEKVDVIRSGLRTLAKVWEWVGTLFKEGPAGVWNRLKEKLGDLWQALLDGVIGWLIEKVTVKALTWLAGLVDISGITAVINTMITIYNTMQTIGRYANQILRIVDSVLDRISDLASGAIAGAAKLIEDLMDRALPVAIGFLAGVLGLGDLSDRIQEIVGVVREKVTEGIDWLIDKAMAVGRAFLAAVGAGKSPTVAAAGDVKERAHVLLSQRLKTEHTRRQAEEIVNAVLTELQPAGLKRLVLGPEGDDGEYALLAEASPLEEIMRLGPMPRSTKVVMGVTLTLIGAEPVLPSVDPRTARIPETEDKTPFKRWLTGAQEQPPKLVRRLSPTEGLSVKWGAIGADRDPRFNSGGFLVEPDPGSNQVQLVTWSTGEPIRDSNVSHAEHQFLGFLKRQQLSWRARIREIEIEITQSPCPNCVPDLKEVLELTPGVDSASLLWRELHSGVNPSTAESLNKLTNRSPAGGEWRIQGPMPSGLKDEKLVGKP